MDKVNVFFKMNEEKLIKQLIEFDKFYYNDAASPVDDEEYDGLKDYAKENYPNNPYFKEVGAPVTGEKVKLPFMLGSLKKIKFDTIQAWLDKQPGDEFVLTEKLDGSSFCVNFVDGKVVFAATRGDGTYGRDITEKAKIFCKPIKEKGNIWCRAEAMLIGKDIAKELGMKTRRNGAAGILNRDYEKNSDKITPVFYEAMNLSGNEMDRLEFLMSVGKTPKFIRFNKRKNLVSSLVNFLEMCKENKEYDIDGLVITPLNYERENVEFPERKVAFKMNEKPVIANVDHVEWKVSRMGRVVPVVHIIPMEIQGVTISKATGFNAQFILDEKIGSGSVVKIVRSGDVIPYITEAVSDLTEGVLVPHNCPSCGHGLSMKSVDLICKYDLCPSKAYKQVEHFLRVMGAENITQKTLIKLGIDTYEKAYEIDEFEIAEFDGFGLRRGEQIVAEIGKTLKTTPQKFICSLGIPLVGKTFSRLVVDYLRPQCENDDHVIEKAWYLTPDELTSIDGVGEVMADSYFKNIRREGESLFSFLVNKGLKWENTEQTFESLTFTITGKGPMGRKEIQTMIEQKGGTVKGIGKSISYLVTGDPDSQTGKAKKARQYGVNIISYKELMEMIK